MLICSLHSTFPHSLGEKMPELCLPTSTKKPEQQQQRQHLSAFLISDFFLLCSLLLSHPLYFLYFIFFSPYLLKLLSFLSPLFLTTALLLLAGALLLHGGGGGSSTTNAPPDELLPDSPIAASFLRTVLAIRSALEKLRPKADEEEEEEQREFRQVRTALEELDVYRIVFEVAEIPVREEDHSRVKLPGEKVAQIELELDELVQEKEIWCETVSYYAVGEENSLDLADSAELEEEKGEEKKPPLTVTAEKASKVSADAIEDLHFRKLPNDSPKGEDPPTNLGSFGSMRKEKEWKRTLACKLFEERHSGGDGEEGMDSLWETHEAESDRFQTNKSRSKKGTRTRTRTKTTKKGCDDEEEDDDEDEEEEREAAQLCCLQALKFSAGKMNLGMGMGRPGLVKISKALKGMGWFHHGGRHGKKGSFH